MGVHKPWDRYFFAGEGSIMKKGSSTQLAKNQIGLFNMEKKDIFGVKAVDVSEIISTDKAFVTTNIPVSFQIDGEYCGKETKLNIEILPKQMKVAIPLANSKVT